MTKETREDGIFTYKIEWEHDDDADLSWMGEFVRQPDQMWYVDRSEGKLYGDYLNGDCIHCNDSCEGQVDGKWVCGDCWETLYTIDDEHEEEHREEYDTQYISYRYDSWHDLRYWQPSENHCPPDKNDGATKEENIRYILEDHAFMEKVSQGDKNAEWLCVELYIGGRFIDEDSLGGIWEATDAYREELIQDAISNLKHRTTLEKALKVLREEIEERNVVMEKLNEYLKGES